LLDFLKKKKRNYVGALFWFHIKYDRKYAFFCSFSSLIPSIERIWPCTNIIFILFKGITTIAGGKWSMGGHMDGPSEDAKLSNDFEVVYMSGSCSLLVVDRGNYAIREIPLSDEDCVLQYVPDYIPLGKVNCAHFIVFKACHERLKFFY
jgi:hypothetical protein